MIEQYLASLILVEFNLHTNYVDLVNLLKVKADLVAYFQAISLRVFPLQTCIIFFTFSILLEVEHNIALKVPCKILMKLAKWLLGIFQSYLWVKWVFENLHIILRWFLKGIDWIIFLHNNWTKSESEVIS